MIKTGVMLFSAKGKTQWSEVLSHRRTSQNPAIKQGGILDNPLYVFLVLLAVVFFLFLGLESNPPKKLHVHLDKEAKRLRQNLTIPAPRSSSIGTAADSVYKCPVDSSFLGCELCRIKKVHAYLFTYLYQNVYSQLTWVGGWQYAREGYSTPCEVTNPSSV